MNADEAIRQEMAETRLRISELRKEHVPLERAAMAASTKSMNVYLRIKDLEKRLETLQQAELVLKKGHA